MNCVSVTAAILDGAKPIAEYLHQLTPHDRVQDQFLQDAMQRICSADSILRTGQKAPPDHPRDSTIAFPRRSFPITVMPSSSKDTATAGAAVPLVSLDTKGYSPHAAPKGVHAEAFSVSGEG